MVETDYFNHRQGKEWATISIYRGPREAVRKNRQVAIVYPCRAYSNQNSRTLALGPCIPSKLLPTKQEVYNLVIIGFNTEMSIKCQDLMFLKCSRLLTSLLDCNGSLVLSEYLQDLPFLGVGGHVGCCVLAFVHTCLCVCFCTHACPGRFSFGCALQSRFRQRQAFITYAPFPHVLKPDIPSNYVRLRHSIIVVHAKRENEVTWNSIRQLFNRRKQNVLDPLCGELNMFLSPGATFGWTRIMNQNSISRLTKIACLVFKHKERFCLQTKSWTKPSREKTDTPCSSVKFLKRILLDFLLHHNGKRETKRGPVLHGGFRQTHWIVVVSNIN